MHTTVTDGKGVGDSVTPN